MIQADMTAYHAPDEPLQLGLPERIGTPEVTALVGNISALYSPELTVGYSSASATLVDCSNHRRLTIPKACCSDHQVRLVIHISPLYPSLTPLSVLH